MTVEHAFLGAFVLGGLFLGLAGMSFRLRAVMNKPAWDGMTKPFALIGVILMTVGLFGILAGSPQIWE